LQNNDSLIVAKHYVNNLGVTGSVFWGTGGYDKDFHMKGTL